MNFLVSPVTFVTDRELALMNALDDAFPATNNLLCRWNISKNILARQRRTFESMKAFKEFTGQWNALVMSSKAQIYQRRLTEMSEVFSRQIITYIEETCLCTKKNLFLLFCAANCILAMKRLHECLVRILC